jgi:hypothetical protein
MLPGFTSAGAAKSWVAFCAAPKGDHKIMSEKNAMRVFIVIIKRNARHALARASAGYF